MSNSSLVDYVRLSPHYDSRNGKKITDITIHHMAGNLTVYQCGEVFQTREASANYGIDSAGRIGLYVDEKFASWANSNLASNRRSITIELANDEIGGNWHVSDKALARCIDLCVDICRRNGIRYINYTGDTSGNLTRHNMFTATTCPGPYLQSKFPYIQNEINRRLGKPDKLDVDGLFGELSTLKLQTFLGTPRDGKITGQTEPCRPFLKNWISVVYNDGYTGSRCINYLQQYLKSKHHNPGAVDGLCGHDTVKALQEFLNSKGYSAGAGDGYFGPNTAKAFQRFLNDN